VDRVSHKNFVKIAKYCHLFLLPIDYTSWGMNKPQSNWILTKNMIETTTIIIKNFLYGLIFLLKKEAIKPIIPNNENDWYIILKVEESTKYIIGFIELWSLHKSFCAF